MSASASIAATVPSADTLRIAVIGLGYVGLPLAVAHRQFVQADASALRSWLRDSAVVFDVKGVLPREQVDDRL